MMPQTRAIVLYLLTIVATLTLVGCQLNPEQMSQGIYDMSRATARQECIKLGHPDQVDECVKRTQTPYDEYDRQRKQL